MLSVNSFNTRQTLTAAGRRFGYYSLPALEKAGFAGLARLPYSLKILLENLLRREDQRFVDADDIQTLARWDVTSKAAKEIAFMPARVLLQDFTGVPAVVDLAAMRDGVVRLGGDPKKVNPLQPVELVIDHSVQVDHFAERNAFELNAELEFSRNRERYVFLRWGQTAFDNFKVVPPDTGIVHQVNLEYLARVVFSEGGADPIAYPDTLVGTDSHTTMVNGLGVVGWGVGGIEAEAAMLGQPISMLIPHVVGFRLINRLTEGATATDLVLTITERLRKLGVVGKFVEFYGPGLEFLTIADRATLGNMSPEYGATIAICPIDDMTLDYLRLTARDQAQVALVEAYAKEQGLFRTADGADPVYTQTIELDLSTVEPCIAGPKRPQDRVSLNKAKVSFQQALEIMLAERKPKPAVSDKPRDHQAARNQAGRRRRLGRHGRGHDRDDSRHGRARSRVGRAGRHHQLYQHVEPERDDRRRTARTQRGAARVEDKAVGQAEPGARLARRHGIPPCRGSARASRRARLQPRRLRLYDLHRQQRAAARACLVDRQGQEPRGRVGALGQSKLRGTHPVAGTRQLPGVSAAGRRLRARRQDADRSDQ
jgi:aconitate hydratase